MVDYKVKLHPRVLLALDHLDTEMRVVVDEHYGLKSGADQSYVQIANKFGGTADSIESLHENALRTLYRPC